MNIFSDKKAGELNFDELVDIFKSVGWPQAEFPQKLFAALANSQELVTAFVDGKLVGIANAVGDDNFYAYIHWLIVHKDFQGKGIAHKLSETLLERLETSNQVFVIASKHMTDFWKSFGFVILQDGQNGELIAAYRGVPKLRPN